MGIVHPDDPTLSRWLAGLSAEAALSDHLRDCPDCARRAREVAALQEALGEEGEASPLSLARMRATLPARRRDCSAAAAVLLALSIGTGLLLFRNGGKPPSPLPVRANRGRLLSPSPGTQIHLSPRADLAQEGTAWRLRAGSCLAFSSGGILKLAVGDAEVDLRDGEVLLSASRTLQAGLWMREAEAAAPDSFEIAVLSGTARIRAGDRILTLAEGDILSPDLASLDRKALAARREAFLDASGTPPSSGRLLGAATRKDGILRLEGGGAPAAWLADAGTSYRASWKLRTSGRPSALGISFLVRGFSTLWQPDAGLLDDGSWHAVHVTLSPAWVVLVLDGRVVHRLPSPGFRTNPADGVAGVGPVVWGGVLEVSRFDLEDLE